jgi:hypothetical protein
MNLIFGPMVFYFILTGLQPGASALHRSSNRFKGLRRTSEVETYELTI